MKRICATIVGASVLVGCAAQPTPQEWEKRAMPFVQDGAATREQLMLKLGEPTAHFENDRILTYRVAKTEKDGVVVVQRERYADAAGQYWGGAEYSLVLVFSGETLQKHSLVPVR